MSASAETIKTRICIISDTHTQTPYPSSTTKHAYRSPLPSADILIHAGDLTKRGYPVEVEETFKVVEATDAELKLVIAGNHDLVLDGEYCDKKNNPPGDVSDRIALKEMAKEKGITYLDEGTMIFELKNGARFTVYASPYTPEYQGTAFAYKRNEDRYNPPNPSSTFKAPNPVPSWPEVDLMITHGPPYGILDATKWFTKVGCENLLTAAKRCRPRLHCFGHIHEAWGAERHHWEKAAVQKIKQDKQKVIHDGRAYVDISKAGGNPLSFGDETLFVNASIMSVFYNPHQAPWLVDLDLPIIKHDDGQQLPHIKPKLGNENLQET